MYIDICAYTSIYIFIHIYIYICTYICTHMYIYSHTWNICISIHIHRYTCTCRCREPECTYRRTQCVSWRRSILQFVSESVCVRVNYMCIWKCKHLRNYLYMHIWKYMYICRCHRIRDTLSWSHVNVLQVHTYLNTREYMYMQTPRSRVCVSRIRRSLWSPWDCLQEMK